MDDNTPAAAPLAQPTIPVNRQGVSCNPKGNLITVLMPLQQMTRTEALEHAAWIVAVAERNDGEFARIVDSIRR